MSEPKSNPATITGSSLTPIISLSVHERQQIAEILDRRSNEIATFKGDLERKLEQRLGDFPGSVDLAITREISRLRKLADKVRPPLPEEDDEE